MSASPTRFEGRTKSESSSPLRKGNLVLESIARQEALPSLLAFSNLHEQIQNRPPARGADIDLVETERFILDEVLQLICDRARTLTHAEGVMVALAEGPYMVCRAASGELIVARGTRLPGESDFLRECLESGNILRCDDCANDTRVAGDLARKVRARSTLLVPLRGRREQLGVVQAFSATARAFSDDDVRNFDLFAELVLSALKPEDQDRRIDWLKDVADGVLQAKPEPVATGAVDRRIDTEIEGRNEKASDRVEDNAASRPGDVLPSLSLPENSRPGLSVVLSLMAVAALLSAATWWGMQAHGVPAHGKIASGKGPEGKNAIAPVTAPPFPPPGGFSGVAGNESADLFFGGSTPDSTSDSDSNSNSGDAFEGAASGSKGVSKITGVRHWSSPVGSTVVIDMDDEVPYEVHRLSSPERIYFDLHGTALAPALNDKTLDIGDVALSRVRIGQPTTGVTRVVLDTRDGASFSVSMESSPYRLVVELQGAGKTVTASHGASRSLVPLQPATAVSAMPAPAGSAPSASLSLQANANSSHAPLPARTAKFRIVLDAGHGGWDLGTVGRKGLLEKDLVLDVTERLGKLLEGRLKSEVVYTRTDDSYLTLDQRADIANQAQADVFVSIHANYSTSASARGVETYYTNMFSAPGSRELEKPDDGSYLKLMPVSLSVGALHDKIEQSRRLAAIIQRSLYATLASNSPDIRNRGIKDAAFVVLTGTTMPSILTEISFVSSPADERNLQSESYRQQIAEALYQGIARYEQASPRTKIAQVRTSAAGQ